jgi:hypothetical protein
MEKPLHTNFLIKKLAIARLRLRNANRHINFFEGRLVQAHDAHDIPAVEECTRRLFHSRREQQSVILLYIALFLTTNIISIHTGRNRAATPAR